jgi:hypothetical protein
MVSYQRFVAIVFDEADGDATELMKWSAERWQRNKEMLSTATVAEARDLVRRTLS